MNSPGSWIWEEAAFHHFHIPNQAGSDKRKGVGRSRTATETIGNHHLVAPAIGLAWSEGRGSSARNNSDTCFIPLIT